MPESVADTFDSMTLARYHLAVAQLIVRNLEDAVRERLRTLAARHGRSMEEEVRMILRAAVAGGSRTDASMGRRIASRFRRCGLAGDVAELRGTRASPATFRR
jgi:plasmid stability protein